MREVRSFSLHSVWTRGGDIDWGEFYERPTDVQLPETGLLAPIPTVPRVWVKLELPSSIVPKFRMLLIITSGDIRRNSVVLLLWRFSGRIHVLENASFSSFTRALPFKGRRVEIVI